MAHINTAGVHIPLWMTSPMTPIGWGQSPWYKTREGTFFGQIMLTNPSNNLDGYYCNGPGTDSNVVPGRLGSNQGAVPYANAWPTTAGMDGLCDTNHSTGKCTLQANGDGNDSCTLNGKTWNNPITVWRGQTFQAEDAAKFGSAGTNACTPASNCGGGKRVSWIRAGVDGITLSGVNVAAAGTNNIVVYYTNGDLVGSADRQLAVKVNSGAVQIRSFPPTGFNWDTVASMTISLSGFNAGTNNTVDMRSVNDMVHQAPDLDWFEVINTSTASAAAVTATDTSCSPGHTISLKSYNNGEYASARTDMSVNAQASSVGSYEQFDIVDAGGGYVAFKSHTAALNGNYLSADIGVSTTATPIRARSTAIGDWERFLLEVQTDGTFAIKAKANGKYVATAGGGANAPLQAISNSVAQTSTSWEKFTCQ
jgi:hypothetical protein